MMFKFFSKIRKKLISDNRVSRYLLYSLGEILLIVIGILIALALDNKSAKTEMERNFNYGLEQLYTNLYLEISWQEFYIQSLEDRMEFAYAELNEKRATANDELPYVIDYINSEPIEYNLDSQHVISQMQENIVTKQHNILMNQVNSYFSIYERWDKIQSFKVNYLDELYKKYKFSQPSDYAVNEFTEEDVSKAMKIKNDPDYEYHLQTTINKFKDLIFGANYKINETIALLEFFKDLQIDLRLNFSNIGIIGTALPENWEKSKPMTLVDNEKAIWKIETYLSDGEIKFRNGNSWNQNWGATDSLDGEILYFGRNIPVKQGFYEVVINLSDKTYELKQKATRQSNN